MRMMGLIHMVHLYNPFLLPLIQQLKHIFSFLLASLTGRPKRVDRLPEKVDSPLKIFAYFHIHDVASAQNRKNKWKIVKDGMWLCFMAVREKKAEYAFYRSLVKKALHFIGVWLIIYIFVGVNVNTLTYDSAGDRRTLSILNCWDAVPTISMMCITTNLHRGQKR